MFERRAALASILLIAFVLASVGPALAQTGPSLVVKPWSDDPHWAESVDDLSLITGGHAAGPGGEDHSIKQLYYDSHGRVKFDREDADPAFSVGYRVLTLEIGGDHPILPGGATDVSLAGALKLGTVNLFDADWEVSLIGGAGTATDNHFGNGDAVYGIGTLNARHVLDESSSLHIGLNYDGNRSIFPDIPLPYATYLHRVSETLAYSVGLPASRLIWRPWERVLIELDYVIPTNIGGRVSYFLTRELSVFGQYQRSLDAFWLHDVDNRRLFYELDRVTAGVRWNGGLLDVAGGVGFAFDQEYSRGWDARDTDTITEPSDEFLFFVTVRGRF